MALSVEHLTSLQAAAITDSVIDASGISTDTKRGGMCFTWDDGNGSPLVQFKPDKPRTDDKGRTVKYVFPSGSRMILNRLRDDGSGPVIICEGTKQQYAVLSHVDERYSVYGMAGCWCWTDADLNPFYDRDVLLLFDGDAASNREVHDAAREFRQTLERQGARSVKFVHTSARGSDGVDDALARMLPVRRAGILQKWIDAAESKLPRAPARKDKHPFFERGSLMVQQATEFLLERQPAALTAERKVALYLNGAYHIDGTAFISAVGTLLGDAFRPSWRAAMEEMALGTLFSAGKLLPERSPYTLLNVANGMLDLTTLELKAHDPEYLSCAQLPVEWDPDAKARRYENWLSEVCPGQEADIEEVAGTMLDPSRTPHKAMFAFGPSRSGKSTFLRLMQAVAGVENRTSVTLHDLSRDRFAAANVYGKVLNSAADLSSAHVEDLSVFKMMTGEDAIHGNRKYGAQFTFTNQALFAFSANELPTVSESSRAYAERIKPFEFPNSFAGREDPTLEGALMDELPGILVRWVEGYRRVLQRGGYSVTDEAVRREFDTRSDRVAQWVADCCTVVSAYEGAYLSASRCTGRRESASAFRRWAERNGGHGMGERKFFDRMRHLGGPVGIYDVREAETKRRAFNIVIHDGDAPDQPFSRGQEDLSEEGVQPVGRNVGRNDSILDTPPDLRKDAQNTAQEAEQALSVDPTHAKSNTFKNSQVEVVAQKVPLLPIGGPSSLTVFDLETCSVKERWRRKDFVRLAGYQIADASKITTDLQELIDQLNRAESIGGHNILGFDLLALARWHGADYESLAAKSTDSLIIARQQDPPRSKGMPPGYYALDALAKRHGHEGKSDDLKRLAKQHGGYDAIPLDDEEYQQYLGGDLSASRALAEAQGPLDPYTAREHRVQTVMGRISLEGMRIDEQLLQERYRAGAERLAQGKDTLVSRYGFPETNAAGKPAAAPQRTGAGKQAFHAALVGSGIGAAWLAREWPLNKDGSLSLAKEIMQAKIDLFHEHGKDAAALICETVLDMNGVRTVYGNVLHWLTDGRVHPSISPEQASGRWSVTEPGITVMGKRGGKHVEREVFLPEPGHLMVAFDLDQVDMRAIAGHCQDPAYMALFAPGRDVHSEVAKAVFGTTAKRDEAKVIGHAWNYGASINRLIAAGATREDSERFDSMMRETYPVLAGWREEVREQAGVGELLDNGYGRHMRVDPDWAYTQAPAAMGQGGTRDIVAEGLLRLPKDIVPLLRAVIHDEAVLSIPADALEDVSRKVKEAFTFEFKGVPITCGMSKPGASWGACYEK